MEEIQIGETIHHTVYGEITILNITTIMSSMMVSEIDGEMVFEGGEPERTIINFETPSGDIFAQDLEKLLPRLELSKNKTE